MASISALMPVGPGQRFVLYGDSCSGGPGALHEQTHVRANAVVARLTGKHTRPAGSSRRYAAQGVGEPQALLAAWSEGAALPALWIGLSGRDRRLTVMIGPTAGRSPHSWFGPGFAPGAPFDVQVALRTGMGPGGTLWRQSDRSPWSSLQGASPWGAERLVRPDRWSVGHGKGGALETAFVGKSWTSDAGSPAERADPRTRKPSPTAAPVGQDLEASGEFGLYKARSVPMFPIVGVTLQR